MKFKFSLEKLLKQRHIQVDLMKKDFLEIQDLFIQEKENLNTLIRIKENSLLRRHQAIQDGINWQSEVEQINLFLLGHDLRIAQQNERLIKLEKEVENKREILRKALVDAKIVETLKEKKKAEFIKDVQTKEYKELDELAALRHKKVVG